MVFVSFRGPSNSNNYVNILLSNTLENLENVKYPEDIFAKIIQKRYFKKHKEIFMS